MRVVLTAQAWAAEYRFEQHYELDTGYLLVYNPEVIASEGRRLMRQREQLALYDIQVWAEEYGEPVARMELSWSVAPSDPEEDLKAAEVIHLGPATEALGPYDVLVGEAAEQVRQFVEAHGATLGETNAEEA